MGKVEATLEILKEQARAYRELLAICITPLLLLFAAFEFLSNIEVFEIKLVVSVAILMLVFCCAVSYIAYLRIDATMVDLLHLYRLGIPSSEEHHAEADRIMSASVSFSEKLVPYIVFPALASYAALIGAVFYVLWM